MFQAFDDLHPVMQSTPLWVAGADETDPNGSLRVGLFRFPLHLDHAIDGLSIFITASQRFELFLDGMLIERGPSRSDPMRWGVREVTLPAMNAGRHLLAVRVIHFGKHSGIGQLGARPFLVVTAEQCPGTPIQGLHDHRQARAILDHAFEPVPESEWGGRKPYFVVGSGQRIIGRQMLWGWAEPDFDDQAWSAPAAIRPKVADPWGNLPIGHQLGPDPLPPMERTEQSFARVPIAPNLEQADALIRSQTPLTIPPQSHVTLVADHGTLTNAYWNLTLGGGQEARIRLISSEAPYTGRGSEKAHRDQVDQAFFYGQIDEILPDGGNQRSYMPLWFRSFRYLKLDIQTADKPLTLHDLRSFYSGYPLNQTAEIRVDPANQPRIQKIMEVSHRTARLCAHETLFDCPHYEQAQFPGDSRVQAVYHYLTANDDVLARKAIDDLFASRLPEGLTQCRHPSRQVQILATFSLQWIGMLADHLLYRGHDLVTQNRHRSSQTAEFLIPYLPFVREILNWFIRHRRPDGLLGRIPHAPFVDWTQGFAQGNAPQADDGRSILLTLMTACAAREAALIEHWVGNRSQAATWRKLHRELVTAARTWGWDAKRRLFRDVGQDSRTAATERTPPDEAQPDARVQEACNSGTPTSFSVHTQVYALLADALPARQAKAFARRMLAAGDLTQPGSFYFRYYLAQALRKVDMGGRFLETLPLWTDTLERTGLSTWPETAAAESRSDCHAWSVTPAGEMFTTVLGITPTIDFPGFQRLLLNPTLGPFPSAEGKITIPKGIVSIELQRNGRSDIKVAIETPVPVIIKPIHQRLDPGLHHLTLPSQVDAHH